MWEHLPTKANRSGTVLINTKLLIYSYCVLIQLLLLFEFLDTIAFVIWLELIFTLHCHIAVRGGGLLLFGYLEKTHESILPLETLLKV